jgi:transposase
VTGACPSRHPTHTAIEQRLSEQIDRRIEPFRDLVELLITISGVNARTTEVLIAETAGAMSRFPSPFLSASIRPRGRVFAAAKTGPPARHSFGNARKGSRWLRGALTESAHARVAHQGRALRTSRMARVSEFTSAFTDR